jgi:hypothetical protein
MRLSFLKRALTLCPPETVRAMLAEINHQPYVLNAMTLRQLIANELEQVDLETRQVLLCIPLQNPFIRVHPCHPWLAAKPRGQSTAAEFSCRKARIGV